VNDESGASLARVIWLVRRFLGIKADAQARADIYDECLAQILR
jgi:hypothetical protein